MRASGANPHFSEPIHPETRDDALGALPLLERDEPLARLSRVLLQSRTHGQVVTVTGEAGVGKTSLIRALAGRLPRPVWFLWGACEALRTPRPLGPILDMAPALGSAVESRLAAGADAHDVFSAVASAVASHDGPRCVVFEDVHWADEATIDLLRYAGRRLDRIAALLVLTWRADDVGPEHRLHRVLGDLPPQWTHHLRLEPLSLGAVSEMAGAARDAHALHALTGGNPFFLTEVLRAGVRAVPASVREAILARRSRLSPGTRHVLDLVSVIPSHADVDLVRAAAGADDAMLTTAMEAGLLTFDGRTVGFRHELARLAVLESLPLLRVQELHRAVLAALSPAVDRAGVAARLVHHAVGAADRAAVQRFAVTAARQAAALGAHCQAAAHCRTALQWADGIEAPARADILDLLAYESYLTGDIVAARAARMEALDLCRQIGDPRAVGRQIRWLSRLAWFLGDSPEAARRADEALEVLSPLGEHEELAMALSNRAQVHMLAHEFDAGLAVGERAIAMARRLGSAEVLSHALNNVGCCLVDRGDPAGRALQEESLALALDRNLHEHAARAYTNLGFCALTARDYPAAARWIGEGIGYACERDLDSWWLYLIAARARLRAETGRWTEAEDDARLVLEARHATAVVRGPALTTLGLLHARQRKRDAADLLDEALALALQTAEKQRLLPVRAARAELALLLGRAEDARAEIAAGLALVGPADLPGDWQHLLWLRAQVEGEAAATLAEHPNPGPHGLQALGRWREAADEWGRLECPYERAEALAGGDVHAMEEALAIFRSLHATPAADRVRQRLRQAGVARTGRGPRRTTRAHPAGLTRREAEILGLLGSRLSNAEIGERLFVSPKTVEHHVSAILAKLQVPTRDEAVAEARRRGWQ